MGVEKLRGIYKRTEIFFCNIEEAKTILNTEGPDAGRIEVKDLITKIRELGPKIVVLTDGSKGAYAYDGNNTYFMPPYPDPKPPVERTGAGDAFASTFTVCLALGKNIEEALSLGNFLASQVICQYGARVENLRLSP